MDDEMIKALSGSMAGVSNPSGQVPDMVERVARAMCSANGIIWGGPKGEDDPDFLMTKLLYMSLAKFAIKAMREPTDAMKEAACDVGPDTTNGGLDWDDATVIWQAMIGAALPSPAIDDMDRK